MAFLFVGLMWWFYTIFFIMYFKRSRKRIIYFLKKFRNEGLILEKNYLYYLKFYGDIMEVPNIYIYSLPLASELIGENTDIEYREFVAKFNKRRRPYIYILICVYVIVFSLITLTPTASILW